MLGDFEILGMKCFGKNVDRRTCFFHFCQNIFKRVKKISLKDYLQKTPFQALAKSLMVMPLLPKKRLEDAFAFLKKKYTSTICKKLISYFERNYIKKRYNRNNWWIGDLTKRTNNNVESFNSRFNRFVRIHNPRIHKLIKKK